MKCNKCNAEVPESARFCPECGAPAVKPVRPVSQSPANNTTMIVLVAVIALLVILLAVGAFFFFTKSQEKTSTAVEETAATEVSAPTNPYAWLSERLVTDSDLADKTADEIRMLRNAIYAMHGYIFQTNDMRDYFSQFSWYEPRYANVDGMLTDLERSNVKFIKRHEGGKPANTSVTPPPAASSQRVRSIGFTGDFSDVACYTRLTAEDVAYLNKTQLRILRNTIYARHGRKFKSDDLRRYFSQFDWYEPRYNEISPSSLSPIEQHNIELIQLYE